MTERVHFADLIDHEIGGGWGEEKATPEHREAAYVIRGTDIPKALAGDVSSIPYRFHKVSNLRSRVLRHHDVVFEVSGGSKGQPVGRALLVTQRLLHRLGGPAMCASFCKLIRLNPARCDPRYVFRLLQAAYVAGELDAFQVQSTGITNFRWKPFLERFEIVLIDRGSQELVAEVLGAIDDLIENNRLRIELLEQMAEAIYREWFVRFRYPGHEEATIVDSPLGPIPYGWQVRNLFDVAEVAFGYSFKSKAFAATGPYPVVRIRDVPGGTTRTFSDEKAPPRYRVLDGDILIGMDGDFHLRQWTGGEAWLNQRVTRLRPLGGLSPRHLLLSIDQPIKEWNAAISGTTVAHLGKRHLEKIQIVVPPAELLTIASEVFAQGAQKECTLAQTNRQLAGLRDLLLPKLVTGQIDVSNLDLDAAVESVA